MEWALVAEYGRPDRRVRTERGQSLRRGVRADQRGPDVALLLIDPLPGIPSGTWYATGEYSLRVDWIYAAAATTIVLLSERRQRRSFYYAGLLNLGIALSLIASHRHWFERPGWALAVIAAGLTTLIAGFALDRAERRRR